MNQRALEHFRIRTEAMAKLWNKDGLSMSEIGSHYGMTRQQVAGIIHRNRELFESRRDANGKKPRKPIATSSQKAVSRRRVSADAADQITTARITQTDDQATSLDATEYDFARRRFAKDILSIGNCECRWWVSDAPLMFCAQEVVAGTSWCSHHAIRASGKGTASERKAVSAAMSEVFGKLKKKCYSDERTEGWQTNSAL